MLALALLVIGVSTDLIVESNEGVAPQVAAALVEDLASAIERKTGSPCRVGESGAEDRVGLSVFGAVTRIRIIAVRRDQAPIQVDVARERDAWQTDLDDLARNLYLQMGVMQKPQELPPATGASLPAETSAASWIVLGTGVTVLAVGIGFLIASVGVRNSFDDPGLGTSEIDARYSQERAFVGVATGAVVVGAGLLIAGLFID